MIGLAPGTKAMRAGKKKMLAHGRADTQIDNEPELVLLAAIIRQARRDAIGGDRKLRAEAWLYLDSTAPKVAGLLRERLAQLRK